MQIIETELEFQNFIKISEKFNWLIVPIYCNGSKTVYTDSISLIYVYVIHMDAEFMLVFNHTEGLSNSIQNILQHFPVSNTLFVYGKKRFYHFCKNNNLVDIDLMEYFQTNSLILDEFDTTAHDFYLRKFGNFQNLNTIIPIVKHYERCSKIKDRFFDIYSKYEPNDSFNIYNNLVILTLYDIEKNGLYVNRQKFIDKFTDNNLYDNYTFSEYNIYTSTGRPSNRFGGVNFAALNKDDGSRVPFESRHNSNGFLLQFDYDGYHLRLLGELVDYQFPLDESAHHHLGKAYYNKTELSTEEYSQTKQTNFRQLYGGINKEYLNIPFFAKVNEYSKLLWEQFNNDGYIETTIFGRKLLKEFYTDMNSHKLMNYLLQNLETERNMVVINSLIPVLRSKLSKIILYTYDSILVDYNKDDGPKLICDIRDTLEQNKQYPTKISVGQNYSNMQDVTI